MRFYARACCIVTFITIFICLTITFLLPTSRAGVHLRLLSDSYLRWDHSNTDGLRVVVFGDAGVDDVREGVDAGRGKAWTEVLCDELECSLHLNLAVSQPSSAYPAASPQGAIVSSALYHSTSTSLLADLRTQVASYVSVARQPTDTLYVVSFGTWDIYNFASLDFTRARALVDSSITELFKQLDILYTHHCMNFDGKGNVTDFRVVLPKLMDPTLLPGWKERTPPLAPSSVAEEQKNAVYLTMRWNAVLENAIGAWLQSNEEAKRDVFYYDLQRWVLNMVIERHMEEEKLTDASGLGKGESIFNDVKGTCVDEYEPVEESGKAKAEMKGGCKGILFYDEWRLGQEANEAIGKAVGGMVRNNRTLETIWKEARPKSGL